MQFDLLSAGDSRPPPPPKTLEVTRAQELLRVLVAQPLSPSDAPFADIDAERISALDELSVAARSRVANAEIIMREAPMLMRTILLLLRPCQASAAMTATKAMKATTLKIGN